jgi:hypothetical protein
LGYALFGHAERAASVTTGEACLDESAGGCAFAGAGSGSGIFGLAGGVAGSVDVLDDVPDSSG